MIRVRSLKKKYFKYNIIIIFYIYNYLYIYIFNFIWHNIHTCTDLWIPYANINWLHVSAAECTHSENILCEPVYNQAHNLNKKLQPFLKNVLKINLVS